MILAPMLVAAAFAGVYLVWEPPSADLAAQTFRTDLFEAHGFLVWSNDWYGGFHVPSYSLLSPPLAAAIGVRLVGAVAAVAAAGLFGALARRAYGERARLGALWFGAATATNLFTGRLTFALGVAVVLAALLAVQRDRRVPAALLGALTTLASPVAGLFLGLAGAAAALSGPRRAGIAAAAGAMGTVAVEALAFPTEGVEPFVAETLWLVVVALALLVALVPRWELTLRSGVVLYGLLLAALFIVPNPVGGNATRLGALFAGPILALVLSRRRNLALALAAVPLLYWQWVAPVRDVADAVDDPSTEATYYAPLLDQLDTRLAGTPARVHVPPTRDRWEAVHVAERYPLARGWLRQSESDDFDLFQDGELSPDTYREWLAERGVSYVAVPDARLDYLSEDEVDLIDEGVDFLEPVWAEEHWRLFRVADPAGLVVDGDSAEPTSDARLASLDVDSFELTADQPGEYLVRVRYTPYWRVAGGEACVERDGDWTRVDVSAPSVVLVEARVSVAGLFRGGERCSG
jgi:hypothetical protein